MAARTKKKPAKTKTVRTRTAASTPTKKTKTTASPTAKKSAASQLRVERDLLKTKLAAAEARIDELQSQHEEAINRIDWVIDSLQSALAERH